ncbi:MAG: CPBP family intramembrane metalloprotease [Dehalococcoidales bacterium]|nr:CPBP family intramembrane metalloprotease [Dehalococcoidales bacterium]
MSVNENEVILQPEQEVQQPDKKTGFGFWSTTGLGLLVMVGYIAVTVVITFAYMTTMYIIDSEVDIADWISGIINDGLFLSIVTIGSSAVCCLLIFIIVIVKKDITAAVYLGLKKVPVKTYVKAFFILAGYMILADVITWLLVRDVTTDWVENVYSSSVVPPLLWAALILFAPAFEELFFRGFLFQGFRNSKIGVWGAVILTSLLWSAMHTQYNIYGIVSIFFIGILFGITRHKTGSVWVTFFMHAVFNTAALVQVALL